MKISNQKLREQEQLFLMNEARKKLKRDLNFQSGFMDELIPADDTSLSPMAKLSSQQNFEASINIFDHDPSMEQIRSEGTGETPNKNKKQLKKQSSKQVLAQFMDSIYEEDIDDNEGLGIESSAGKRETNIMSTHEFQKIKTQMLNFRITDQT